MKGARSLSRLVRSAAATEGECERERERRWKEVAVESQGAEKGKEAATGEKEEGDHHHHQQQRQLLRQNKNGNSSYESAGTHMETGRRQSTGNKSATNTLSDTPAVAADMRHWLRPFLRRSKVKQSSFNSSAV